jgi:hypothetical protein
MYWIDFSILLIKGDPISYSIHTQLMKKRIISFLLLTLICFLSCNTTEPPENNEELGRRDYIWTIDTIYSGSLQTYLTSIWGSSSSNVWICGHDANNLTKIYQFNGNEWSSRIDIPLTYFIKNYTEVTGIDSEYAIFVGGAFYINNNPPPNFLDSSLIVEYINGNWKVTSLNNSYEIASVYANSKNDIWAGDRDGNLLHSDGNVWTSFSLGPADWFINEIEAINSNEVYCIAHSEKMISPGEFYIADYLSRYNGSGWALVDSNIASKDFSRNSFPTLLKSINGTLYGSGDNGFVKKAGGGWEIIKSDIYGQFNGNGENNIFLGNRDFGVMHYNGKDWYKFNELPHLSYFGIMVFDDAVFLLASDGQKSYVVRGKLKI